MSLSNILCVNYCLWISAADEELENLRRFVSALQKRCGDQESESGRLRKLAADQSKDLSDLQSALLAAQQTAAAEIRRLTVLCEDVTTKYTWVVEERNGMEGRVQAQTAAIEKLKTRVAELEHELEAVRRSSYCAIVIVIVMHHYHVSSSCILYYILYLM